MPNRLIRSKKEPIREGITLQERWSGPDRGLIWCWERGRQKRLEDAELARRASEGELPILAWKGGVEKKSKNETKPGTLHYLATWQGLRNESLDIALDDETPIVCSKHGQKVVFSSKNPPEDEEEAG